MNDLLKEAIADAKAVRETALANAKIALEEAFTPRLQSMLSAKLAEEEGMEEEPAPEPAPEMEAPAPEPAPEPEPAMEEDEDMELEAIIRELEGSLYETEGEEEMTEAEDKEEMDEVSDSTKIGTGDNKMNVADGGDQDDPGKGKLKEGEGEDEKVDEDISLDEIIAALREGEGEEEEVNEAEEEKMDEAEDKEEKVDEAKDEELKEAYTVIRFLRSKINEVNLLNAKLLFSNKLFRNHSLNENQKMKVIENFDRATTLREVKLVYSTLAESFNVNKAKRQIKESYASAPSRSTAPNKTILNEGNELAARWKKLANLK